MPVLKKLVSSLRLRKDKHDGVAEAADTGDVVSRKTQAKLQKRNRSALDLDAAPRGRKGGLLDDVEPPNAARPRFANRFMQSFVSSRQSSFEPVAIEEDFDAELRELEAALARTLEAQEGLYAQGPRHELPKEEPMASKLGLRVNTANLRARTEGSSVSVLSPTSANPRKAVMGNPPNGRYVYPDHVPSSLIPDPDATPYTDKRIGDAISPAMDHAVSSGSWTTMLEDYAHSDDNATVTPSTATSTPTTSSSQSLQASEGPSRNPFRDSSRPAIRDIDWSQVDERVVAAFVDGYVGLSPGSTPPDSAVAMPQDNRVFKGKGKARAVHLGSMDLDQALDEHSADMWVIKQQEHLRLAEEARVGACAESEQSRLEQEVERIQREDGDRLKALELQEELEREFEEEQKLAEERARVRDCAVCGDSKDPLEFPARAPTSTCTHPAQTCFECLQSWMASEFSTKGCDGIICVECPEILDYADVQRAASAETFEAYDKMSMRNALGSLPEFGWCLGSNCGSGQLNVENNGFMDCANCGYKQCLACKVPWHSNETCEQYEYRTSGQKARDDEVATEAMLDTMSKRCPGPNCGWRIQKTDGCDHMTCKKCKHEFCWQCQASQSEIKRIGNTAHDATCQFHSANLEVVWPFNVH